MACPYLGKFGSTVGKQLDDLLAALFGDLLSPRTAGGIGVAGSLVVSRTRTHGSDERV